MVALQPNFSEKSASPAPDAALPIYVQKFKRPDINDMLPYFAKYGGTIHVITMFTPYIQAVKTAENRIENGALFPFTEKIKSAEINPAKNTTDASISSLFINFRYITDVN